MMYLICCRLIVLLSIAGYASAQGSTFAIAFMNITPDVSEAGFVQLFAISTNVSAINIQTLTVLSYTAELNGPLKKYLNITRDFNELPVTEEAASTRGLLPKHQGKQSQLGVVLSASAGNDVNVYGVKSDKGTTDGFLALPLTESSTAFFIAAWNCSHEQFFAAFQIVSPLEDTCVEIYEVDGDKFTLLQSKFLSTTFETYRYMSSFGKDLTGHFINSSRPIAVYSGHACAFVPEGKFFCDHIVEQIPPISELGKMHIVPPIIGRDANAGYVVRVVSADLDNNVTNVQWVTPNDAVSGSQMVNRGRFVEIYNTLASQPMKVECDHPCLVMLYNTGRNTITGSTDPVATDPFMMLIAAEEHFTTASGFPTASFCEIQNNIQYRQHFINQLTIITKTADTAAIMFDGQAVTTQTQWRKASNWGYSYAAFPVTHGAHFITVTQGSAATFGAYAYGHSLIDTSSSAYGYTVGFKVAGKVYAGLWESTRQELIKADGASLSTDCKQERILSGSAVAQYPSAANPLVMTYPIELGVNVNSGPMSSACRELYMLALAADLKDRSRLINEMICNGSMCPYMSGAPGSGVPVNQSAILTKHVVFVAIDTASLTNPVSFDVDSTGGITTINVQLPYTGIMETTVETFARCRVEVRAFLRKFVNWPHNTPTALLPTPSGCPQITFTAPFELFTRRSVCSLP